MQEIVIRFNDDHIQDLHLDITNVDFNIINTSWLRRIIRTKLPKLTLNKRLKFIRLGTLITKNSNLSELISNFFSSDTQEEQNFFIHCNIGTEELSNDDLINEDNLDLNISDESQTTQAIGLDRLQALGFTPQEIEVLRQQFRDTYGNDLDSNDNNDNNNNNIQDSTTTTRNMTNLRELEEHWMNQGNNTTTTMQENDTFNSVPIANYKHNKDLLIGLCIGLILGLFSLLLLKCDGLFNKRQKMAIMAGVIGNVLFGFVRSF